MNLKKLAVLSLALLFIVSTVLAQRDVGTIVGQFRQEGLKLPGATVDS